MVRQDELVELLHSKPHPDLSQCTSAPSLDFHHSCDQIQQGRLVALLYRKDPLDQGALTHDHLALSFLDANDQILALALLFDQDLDEILRRLSVFESELLGLLLAVAATTLLVSVRLSDLGVGVASVARIPLNGAMRAVCHLVSVTGLHYLVRFNVVVIVTHVVVGGRG